MDPVLETPDERVAGIEVKSTSRLHRSDAKWLTLIRDKLAKRFVAGHVLHTGNTTDPLGDRVAAVSMDVLWTT